MNLKQNITSTKILLHCQGKGLLTLGDFCFTVIGRANTEGSKSNVSMSAWVSHQPGKGSRAGRVRLLAKFQILKIKHLPLLPTINLPVVQFIHILSFTYKFGTVFTLAHRCLQTCSVWTKLHRKLACIKESFLKKMATLKIL